MHRSTAARARRVAVAVGALCATLPVLALLASPASAHGRGSDATNYVSRVTAAPDLPGVTWRVHGADEYLSVENTGDGELVVLDYEPEDPTPYARVGPDGVFVNRNSPAYYVNQDRLALTQPPADLPTDPDWQRLSSGTSFTWHDHRIHWMSPADPPVVRQSDGTRPLLVQEWVVPFTYGGEPYAVEGDLRWVPGPSPWPWLATGLLLTLPALAGLRSHPRGGEWPGLARPAALVLGVVALLNLTHLVDDLVAVPVAAGTKAVAAVQTGLFCALGIFGALRAWRGGNGAFTALGIGSGALLVGQGLLYATVLGVSQAASVFPDALVRLVVALSLAQALTVGAATVLGAGRLAPPPVERAPSEASVGT